MYSFPRNLSSSTLSVRSKDMQPTQGHSKSPIPPISHLLALTRDELSTREEATRAVYLEKHLQTGVQENRSEPPPPTTRGNISGPPPQDESTAGMRRQPNPNFIHCNALRYESEAGPSSQYRTQIDFARMPPPPTSLPSLYPFQNQESNARPPSNHGFGYSGNSILPSSLSDSDCYSDSSYFSSLESSSSSGFEFPTQDDEKQPPRETIGVAASPPRPVPLCVSPLTNIQRPVGPVHPPPTQLLPTPNGRFSVFSIGQPEPQRPAPSLPGLLPVSSSREPTECALPPVNASLSVAPLATRSTDIQLQALVLLDGSGPFIINLDMKRSIAAQYADLEYCVEYAKTRRVSDQTTETWVRMQMELLAHRRQWKKNRHTRREQGVKSGKVRKIRQG